MHIVLVAILLVLVALVVVVVRRITTVAVIAVVVVVLVALLIVGRPLFAAYLGAVPLPAIRTIAIVLFATIFLI